MRLPHGRSKDNILLRQTTAADLPDLMSLWNDGRIMRWVGFPNGLGYTETSIARWFEVLRADPRRHHFVVVSSSLGFCGEAYYAVDAPHRRAGLDIKFRPEAQGGGRAAAALRELIRLVFRAEPLVEAVWTEPSEENLAARTLYWSCGLREVNRPPDMTQGDSYWELARTAALRMQNKELVRRYYEEIVSTGDVDRLGEFISADYVEIHRNERHAIGLDGARQHVVGVRATYPDLRLRVEQQIAEDEWVVTRVTMRGTHEGEWLGIEPTGVALEVTAVNIDKVVDGRIVEHGGAADLLEPLLSIGAVRVGGPGSG